MGRERSRVLQVGVRAKVNNDFSVSSICVMEVVTGVTGVTGVTDVTSVTA